MKAEAYSILKLAITNHRELILGSKSACLGVMKDYGGREHPEVNLLSEAVEENIPERLMSSHLVTQEIIDSLAGQFSSKRFYALDISIFVVSSWADALGLYALKPSFFINSAEQRAATPQEREWHYMEGGAAIGPITESHLKSLTIAGQIDACTVVWSVGMADWELASKYFSVVTQPVKVSISRPVTLPVQVQSASTSKHPTQVNSATSEVNQPLIYQYGGIRRRQYLGICFGIFIVNIIVLALISAGEKNDTLGSLIAIMFAFIYVVPTFYRLKNTGSNPWRSLALIIPIIGLFIGIRCLIYQEGYDATKKLDSAGKTFSWIIGGIFVPIILCIILAAVSK